MAKNKKLALMIIEELEFEETKKTEQQRKRDERLKDKLLKDLENTLGKKYGEIKAKIEFAEPKKLQIFSTCINLFGYESIRKYMKKYGGTDEIQCISGLEWIILNKNLAAKVKNRNGKKLSNEAFELMYSLPFKDEINLNFDIFRIKGKEYVLPFYTLGVVRGRTLFSKKGKLKAMIRKKGKIKAIPKINSGNGGRTCYVPSMDIEIKGIGTIAGMPYGNYGQRTAGETPDPVGGMLEGKAKYEFVSNLYSYLGGIDVPEPIGVATIPKMFKGQELKGPTNGDRLAVFIKRTKTFLRGGDKENKARKELEKMNYLGLLHCWYHSDNYNAEGQILDTEGVRIAEDAARYGGNTGNGGEHQDKIKLKANHKKEASNLWLEFLSAKRIKRKNKFLSIKKEAEIILEKSTKLYNKIEEEGTRIVPSKIIKEFVPWLVDNMPLYEARNVLRDPREDIGRLAYQLSKRTKGETKQKALKLYERFQQDMNKTFRIARSFKNVDLLYGI